MPASRTSLLRPPSSLSDATPVGHTTSRPINMPPPSNKEPLSRRRPVAPRNSTMDPALKAAAPEIPVVGRYHPLNFYSKPGPNTPSGTSSHSSTPATPDSPHSPAGSLGFGLQTTTPRSPRSHMRTLSEAERRLHGYYRERAFVTASRSMFGPAPAPEDEPHGPKLAPAASPGIVTPLELETTDGYFATRGGIVAATQSRSGTPSPTASRGQRSGDSSPRTCSVFMFDKASLSPRTPPAAIGGYC